MTAYDAVLFDNDGVLVEPPSAQRQTIATRRAFRSVGVDPDPQHVSEVVDGVTVARLRDICDAHGVEPREFWAAREYHDEQAQMTAFERGARERYEDVDAIAALPDRRAVVSNNHHSTVGFVLDHFDLDPLFDAHRGREKTVGSLARKKPDPHYLERTLDDLGAEDALYVGDKESDVVAAKRAGLDSALLRRSHNSEVDLSVSPTCEVASLHELRDHLG